MKPSLQPQIYCPNRSCSAPLNNFGEAVCANCQTPLVYRYVWAVGASEAQAAPGMLLAGRYYVVSSQVWLDTQPGLSPDFPSTAELPDEMVAYLMLYPYRLHLPEVYGVCVLSEELATPKELMLLENVPLDQEGKLLPAIAQLWPQAKPVRQVYWLWQLLQLWQPLLQHHVVSSLLAADNIRIEGWRVRLCQLFQDQEVFATSVPVSENQTLAQVNLGDLANLWSSWLEHSEPEIATPLAAICQQMRSGSLSIAAISAQLNRLLLEQAATSPLYLQLVGLTDTGPQYQHNEDTCYPLNAEGHPIAVTGSELSLPVQAAVLPPQTTIPGLAIVCDGIGGHDGGEIASQLAVQSLTMQVQAFLNEVAQQAELLTPDLIGEQLVAIARVVNNLIANQNDAQGREARRRMGTTLVMALQVPQRVTLPGGSVATNSHELYLLTVGDSRVYWLTQDTCQLLSLDDDVASREVRMGRSPYREALQRPDAGALTQALGTRDGEFLRPMVQRLIIEEDGLLLLCSDGLSDHGWVEKSWMESTDAVLRGRRSLRAAVQDWLTLANKKNGHDNVSVVMMHCRVSSPLPAVTLPETPETPIYAPASEWSESSQALADEGRKTILQGAAFKQGMGLFLLLLVLLGSGLFAWYRLDPPGFEQWRQRVLPPN